MKIFDYSKYNITWEDIEYFFICFNESEKGNEWYYNLVRINGKHFLPTWEVFNTIKKVKAIRFLGYFPRTFIRSEIYRKKGIVISNFSDSPKGESEDKKIFLKKINNWEIKNIDLILEYRRMVERII